MLRGRHQVLRTLWITFTSPGDLSPVVQKVRHRYLVSGPLGELMRRSSAQDELRKALLNPAAAYESRSQLLADQKLNKEEKIETSEVDSLGTLNFDGFDGMEN